MRLTELEPQFVRYEVIPNQPVVLANDPLHFPEGGTHVEFRDKIVYRNVDTLAEAQGIMFLCPVCFKRNDGPVGTHSILCWSRERGTPDTPTLPARWRLDGTDYSDLTLNAEHPNTLRSVQLTGPGCRAHFNVTHGEVTPA